MIGTYPQMKIDRYENRIKELEEKLKKIRFRAFQSAAYWNGPERNSFLELANIALDNSEKYATNKVEGEGPMGYYGDV